LARAGGCETLTHPVARRKTRNENPGLFIINFAIDSLTKERDVTDYYLNNLRFWRHTGRHLH